ncbi:MAG TPA: nitrogen regulation protein NR(I), partial [Gammaproteobacteria bacterium]|nr:nitrogen regulation protein NR(I) [Gammaproteobacteria bacterium]
MSHNDTICVIDDDSSIRWVLHKALSNAGLQVNDYDSADTALTAINKQEPAVIVTDIRMPGMDGLELLELINTQYPDLPVIIMTAHSDLDSAVSAYKGGAFEYLPKPFDVDEAIALVNRALEVRAQQPAEKVQQQEQSVPEIIGKAPAMQEVFRAIGRLSNSNATVLINGESGTGKELVALALHRHSARAANPFVALNMAAIPRDLLESELF